ncbi:formate--tetrahydrofolate ligase [Nocardioides pyridinolyticus]
MNTEEVSTVLSDIEIARAATLRPIRDVAAETLGIEERHLVPYGHFKAKIDPVYLASLADRPLGRLVLMTALSPTPPGEGKTTTTVGLTDALHGLGHRALACLREPSMGPVFGMKGGAAGGGYSQVVPMTDINLHFTGDFAAIAAANNLLAALIDNHVHHGNELDIDVRSVTWKRVLDMNDRALRSVVVALGGHANGFPREDGFDIVVASELMAIFCLTESWADLKRRIGDIVIGYDRSTQPVTARDLGADGAMAALLRDAIAPNLVQTLEGAPAFVHGGPFANIAHGCSSVMATRAGLRLADIVVTEAGFGADLGAEKFVDIKCRKSGLRPDVAVVVATVRALKYHGGVALADLGTEDLAAVEAGMANLRRHLDNVRDVYGIPCVVAVNRFPTDTAAEVDLVVALCAAEGVQAYPATHFADGGAGAAELAKGVLAVLDEPSPYSFSFTYPDELSLSEKVTAVATRLYGAGQVTWDAAARRRLQRIERDGYGSLPVCVAKTQYSFSTDPAAVGAPSGHELHVREVRLSAGAGFVVVVCGDMMTMPGLPRDPSAARIDLADDGTILGLS